MERDYNPQVRAAVLRLSQLAGEADDEFSRRAAQLGEQLTRAVPGGVELLAGPPSLGDWSDYLLRTLLQHIWQDQRWPLADMSLEKWRQLADLARAISSSPAQIFPGNIRAERCGSALRLTRS